MSGDRFPRMRRVNSIIWEVLAEEVHGLSDPRLFGVTITGVDTSPDLRRAVVYFSRADMSRLEETGEGFKRGGGTPPKLAGVPGATQIHAPTGLPARPGSDRGFEV